MRLLAISYMLPPMLYPQAIQVGRLLAHVDAEFGTVSGCAAVGGAGLDCYTDLERKFAFHLRIPCDRPLQGLAFYLARRILPLYARVPDEFRSWVADAERAVVAQLAKSAFQPDAIVTFGEPMSDHLLGLRLKRRFGHPWIAHFSDPWVDNPFRAGEFLSAPVNRRRERAVIAAADQVIFTSEETLALVMAKYPVSWRDKSHVLPHSFDRALYPAPAAKGSRLVIRHLGNFYGARTPYPLLRALRALHDREPALLRDADVELIGRVPMGLAWHPSYRALPKGLVRVRGTVSYLESLRLMTDADLLLVMDAPADISIFLPSKLIDYLGSGTRILGIVPPGTSASLIERLGGVSGDPRRPDDVVAALREAILAARADRARGDGKPWGTPAVRAEFQSVRTAAAFLDMIRTVLPR